MCRRETFCKSRAIYRRKLLEKKNYSCIKFCERVSHINEWQLPYKLEANKLSRPLVIGSLQREGMAATTNIRSSIDIIVDVYPQDTEHNEPPEQKNMRVTVAQYGTPNADRMFTKLEFRQVALQVFAGVAPLGLRALEVHAKFLMTAIKIPAVYGTEFKPTEYEPVADLWDTHPPLRKSLPFDLSEPFGSEIEFV
ncbi:hypothetical protein CDAR_531621 [Caerostris darwini]|uniref:Uncharacterized protein n=1 Tax=Caerostris darwini TaxID=1538125 RepID=A0AAV4QVR1_9ARAC|nr:hypothetical protein CDAR_531621 [Caerostris darwini]